MGQSVKTTLAPENPQNRKKAENQKMCHPSQSSPNQNQAWQGVYPDLSTFNALFSPAAPTPNPQSSPWISFLGSLGLQPIPQEQQQQGSAQEHPSAPPVPEENPAGQTFAGSNVNSQPNQGSDTQSPSPSSVPSPSSASSPASLASSSIPPSTLCWPPRSLASLFHPSWPAMSSIQW